METKEFFIKEDKEAEAIFVDGEKYLTVAQCAEAVGYSRQRIYQLCKHGIKLRSPLPNGATRQYLRHVEVPGGGYLVLAEEVIKFPWRP